ncbi:MAG: hypothetical protein H0W75_11510 [Chitinophagaceae bacterium]|nr:hypothetical protein [Chitinophagaceae bacterium]
MNFRTLHSKIVPRGGGIAMGTVFSILVIWLWAINICDTWMMLALGLGGITASILGFVDDVYEISATKKFIAQTCLSIFFFIVFFYFHSLSFNIGSGIVFFIVIVLFWLFVPLWFINLFNFVDGIDGMLISGSIFACLSAIIVLSIKGGDINLILLFSFLTACCIGFSFFNLPPASLFIGDSGSIFLGYLIAVLTLTTIYMEEITIWNWMIILTYFLADTTITTIMRILLVKKWYGVHRSHAYQNLARVKGSHAKVTYGVLAYNLLWVLPLLIWSVLKPGYAPLAAFLSLTPAVMWAFRFGPMFSST